MSTPPVSHPGLDRNTKGSRVRSMRSSIMDLLDQRAEIDDPSREYDNKTDALYDLLAIALAATPESCGASEGILRTKFLEEQAKLLEIEEKDDPLDGMPVDPLEVIIQEPGRPSAHLEVKLHKNVVTKVGNDQVGLEVVRFKDAQTERRAHREGIAKRRKQIRQVRTFLEKWNIWRSDFPIRDDAPSYTAPEAAQGTSAYDAILKERTGGNQGSDES